jgi:hypothetical protein
MLCAVPFESFLLQAILQADLITAPFPFTEVLLKANMSGQPIQIDAVQFGVYAQLALVKFPPTHWDYAPFPNAHPLLKIFHRFVKKDGLVDVGLTNGRERCAEPGNGRVHQGANKGTEFGLEFEALVHQDGTYFNDFHSLGPACAPASGLEVV